MYCYRDDPWTTKSDPGFEEFYDVGADPYQVPTWLTMARFPR